MKEYTKSGLTVIWDETKCIHSGNCVKNLSKVFNPRLKPWINMHNAGNEEIMKTIDKCPSGALRYNVNS